MTDRTAPAPAPAFDPVRQRFLEALARRAAQTDGPARDLLNQRLARALAAYEHDAAAARAASASTHLALQARHPADAARLQRLWDIGDFSGMRRLGQSLAEPASSSPLAGLLRHINRSEGPSAADGATAHTATPGQHAASEALPELRAVNQARSTWTRLRVDRQLAKSLARLPDNPGPLNSQRLVLRCLQRLQALSPAYLACLMAQLDTLVWLEQASPAAPRDGLAKATASRGHRGKAR